MPSIRHTKGQVLDAARQCVLEVGIRRLTLTDVARQAGMSRMTVYRRFPDADALVRDLLTREFAELIETSRSARPAKEGDRNARRALVAQTVAATRAMQDNPLFVRVLDVDPELLVPYLVNGLGSTQRRAVKLFVEGIQRGQADGSVRPGPVPLLAHTMLLTVQSFAVSRRSVEHIASADEYGEELTFLLDSYLASGRTASNHEQVTETRKE